MHGSMQLQRIFNRSKNDLCTAASERYEAEKLFVVYFIPQLCLVMSMGISIGGRGDAFGSKFWATSPQKCEF